MSVFFMLVWEFWDLKCTHSCQAWKTLVCVIEKTTTHCLCTIGNINIMENTKTFFFALLLVSTRLIPEYLWTFQVKPGRHQREIQLRKMCVMIAIMCTTGLCLIFFYIYLTIPFDFMQLLTALHRRFSTLTLSKISKKIDKWADRQ